VSRFGFLSQFRAAYRLAQLFDQHQIDVVHVHYAKDLPIVSLAKRLSRRRWKLVMTRQMEMPGSKKDFYHRWVYSKVDHVICVTEKLKKDLQERLPLSPDKISRLYYGVPVPEKNLLRQEKFLQEYPTTSLKVAMFSRLEKNKGQWRLIKVQKELKKRGIDIQLYLFGHFMGGDGYEQELQELIQKEELSQKVYFCGFQKKPSELMGLFDLIVLPSDEETFGLVLIEAMASGVAVMGANTGGVPEIIEDGVSGFTFSPKSIDEFVSKAEKILTDQQLRASFAKQGQLKYQENFTADEHFQKLSNFFKLSIT
ncbi:glycosyltransferase family 4 protein, partial [bacterium]|nr:glycosyltransferase family 4 protein [bacterium]